MTSSAEDTDKMERADGTSDLAVDPSDARVALARLHFEADVARRTAIDARLAAERARLAGYTRARHRP